MTKLRSLIAFSAIAVASAVVPAFGSEADPLHVSVPFAFKAGTTTLPAGDYTIAEENSGVIMIKGTHGNAIVLSWAGAENNSDKAGVSFARNERGYVLKSVHAWGRMSSSILPVAPSQEK